MTTVASTTGPNKSPTPRLLWEMWAILIHFVRVLHLFPCILVSCVAKWQYLLQEASFCTFLYTIIFSPNKPNQQKKLFDFIKHPYFSWEGTQQTINLSLFVLRSPFLLKAGSAGACGSQSAAIRPEEKMNGPQAEGVICWGPVWGGKVHRENSPVVRTPFRITRRLQHN